MALAISDCLLLHSRFWVSMPASGKPSSMLSCAMECHLRMPSPLSGLFGTSVASQRKSSSESAVGRDGRLAASGPFGEERELSLFWPFLSNDIISLMY